MRKRVLSLVLSLGTAFLWGMAYVFLWSKQVLPLSLPGMFMHPLEVLPLFMPFLFWSARYFLKLKKLWHFSGTILFCYFNFLFCFVMFADWLGNPVMSALRRTLAAHLTYGNIAYLGTVYISGLVLLFELFAALRLRKKGM